MNQQIVAMLELQDAMNTKVHEQWRIQGFEWYRAIWIECAELMDHYGWKWWKKQTPDKEQVTLELIDIWHFGLSLMMEQESELGVIAERVEETMNSSVITGEFLQDVECFASAVLSSKSFDLKGFVMLMRSIDLSFEDLYRHYVGKNVLNFFRQDNGYKNGTYVKNWRGKEDNEHLVDIIQTIEIVAESFRDDVYAALQQRYNTLCPNA